jgi:hypothetical protein
VLKVRNMNKKNRKKVSQDINRNTMPDVVVEDEEEKDAEFDEANKE